MYNYHMLIKYKNLLIILFLIVFLCLSITSCRPSQEVPIENYFNYLRKLEYPRIYTMLSEDSKEEVSLNELCDRYEHIYSEITVNSMTYTLVSTDYTEDTCYVFFILNIESEKLGSFVLNMSSTFVKEHNVWKLDWEPSMLLPGMEDEDVVRITSYPAARGEIFDKNGVLLAENAIAETVYINIDKIQNDESIIRVTAPILNMDESKIIEKLEPYYEKLAKAAEETNDDTTEAYISTSKVVILKAFPKDNGLTEEEKEQLLSVPGIGIDNDYMTKIRYYPQGTILSHTIGYVGLMTAEEAALSENIALSADTMIGKSGLEKEYEMTLRAKPSYKLSIIDKFGHEKQVIVYYEGQNGSDLRLNIDIEVQIKAELLLMENLTSEMRGSVVVLNPYTGALEAMASYPSFDPNLFTFPMTDEQWAQINDPINAPLYNRAISGLYPPGSTFKPFTAAIAIDTNSVSNNFVFKEPIVDNVWTPSYNEWVYQGITRYSKTPGELNLSNAITYSDNIFFAYEALQIGIDSFYNYCVSFGMNQAIPFDLKVSSAKISNTDSIGDIKLLADSGYGQGELLITPLQMASLFSAFANNGDIMQPQLIDSINKIQDNQYIIVDDRTPTVWKEDIVSSYAISTLSPLLRRVITHGTGTGVYISGMQIYGKTGTAEIGNDESREIAWFVGYTLGTEPRLVCVTLEVPAEQGEVRFIIAKELFR